MKNPRARLGVATLIGLAFALTISVGFAGSNDYPVGRAVLLATNSSGVTGEAIVRRQLTAGTTHVMVRAAGVGPSSAALWKIETGAYCGLPSTTTLLTQAASPPITSLNTFMTAATYAATLAVSPGSSMMTIRIYGSVAGNPVPVQLACGQVYDQPSLALGGSQHWW